MALALHRARKIFLGTSLLAATASALLILGLAGTRSFQWLESGTYDARARWAASPNQADKRIVIIDVDEGSFNGLKDKLGRWPWSRRVWASMLYHLWQGKPRVIVFDTIFGGNESDVADNEFASRIREAGRVLLAYSLSDTVEMGFEGEDLNVAKLSVLDREALAAPPNAVGEPYQLNQTAFNVPLEALAASAAGIGCVTNTPDPDGTNRRMPLQFLLNGRVYPSLAVRTVNLLTTAAPFERRGDKAVRKGLELPVDASGRMVILWHGGSSTYERIPAWKLIASIYPSQFPENILYYPPEYFRDKIVLIGASAAGSMEGRSTPFSEVAPGFIMHAAAIDNLLHGDSVQPTSRAFLVAAVFAMALLGASLIAFVSRTSLELVGAGAIILAYGIAAFFSLSRLHLWIPLVAPVGALVLSFGSTSLVHFATTGRELRRTRNTLDRYVSPALVSYVLENLDKINLGGERRELTIFFSDVRNFTTLTEGIDAIELIRLLDDYFQAMTDVIFKYDGIVDKFIGDGILAYWGAFTPGKNHALLASQAALEMITRLAELNERWVKEGRPSLSIGIGINTGNVVFGNIGRGRKIEFTVIGDAVNLAARLEGLNKEFGTSIIISEFTLNKLGESARITPLGKVKVKGKTIETSIFELKGLAQSSALGSEAQDSEVPVSANIPDAH